MMFYLFRHYNNTFIGLGLIGCVIIYIFDFLTYSNVFLKEYSVIFSFYFVLAIYFNNVNNEQEQENQVISPAETFPKIDLK